MTTHPQRPMEAETTRPALPVKEHEPTGTSFSLSVLVPVYNERYLVETSLRRVLALKDEIIHCLEVIVVDDCSSDGSWEILQRIAAEDERVTLLRHERNMGKGAALRTALANATGDISIVHNADLECNPAEIPFRLRPFSEEAADAVFGSRYLSCHYRRALMFRHTWSNKALTFVANIFTDLNLSDIETCYKAIPRLCSSRFPCATITSGSRSKLTSNWRSVAPGFSRPLSDTLPAVIRKVRRLAEKMRCSH